MSDIILMSKPHFDFGNTTTFNPPSSPPMPNKIPLPVKAPPSEYIDPQSYSRAIAKISSLERTIERLNHSHASVLKDLHTEVENLQNTISDLTLKKSMKSGSLSSCNDINHRKVDIAESKVSWTATTNESQESIYILLQEQKHKFKGIIDRLSLDNKRKTNTIELLKNQLDLIKKALSLAGLELDMKELQSLLSNRLKERTEGFGKNREKAETEVVSQFVPKPSVQPCIDTIQVSLVTEPKNNIRKASNFQEIQSQITKSYIEHILNLNRESMPNHENIFKRENIIKASKYTKEAPKAFSNLSDSIQEAVSEPPKTVFNPKEPLPPIHAQDKQVEIEPTESPMKEIIQKKSDALGVEHNFEAFETVSLNRWKNDADMSMITEHTSILELMNGQKSIITDKVDRKQKLREKRSKGI